MERSRELRRQIGQLAGLAGLSARERLREFLQSLVEEVAGADSMAPAVDLPLRDWELAQLLAITPQYLSRLMHELVAEGRLARRGHHWAFLHLL